MARRILRLFLLSALLLQTGCGIVLQSIFGWSTDHTQTSARTHTVQVQSTPPGAKVTRRSPQGEEVQLGQAPLTDTLPYQHEEVIESPSSFGLLIGGAISLAVGIGCFVAAGDGSSSSSSDTDPFLNDGFALRTAAAQTSSSDVGSSVALYLLGGTAIYLGVQDLIIGLIYGLSGDSVKSTRNTAEGDYVYTASAPGLPNATQTVKPPDRAVAQLILDGSAPTAVAVAPPPPPPPPPRVNTPPPPPPPSSGSNNAVASAEAKSWVIAVMDVEQVSATNKGVEQNMVKNLGDQLRIFIAQTGVRTIDRSAQDRALKDQLQTMKSESYKECYDNSCQIELGKALAASHILRSRIAQFGSKCVLNAELIDLRSEVTIKAASSRGVCEPEGFLGMSEEVAKSLVN